MNSEETTMKKILLLSVAVAMVILGYTRLSDSKKRFLRELARQIPWLVPRYFA